MSMIKNDRIEIRNGNLNDYDQIRIVKHNSIKNSYVNFTPKDELITYLEEIKEWDPAADLALSGNFLRVAIDKDLNVIVGYTIASYHEAKDVIYVDEIRVDTGYQSKGCGSMLLDDILRKDLDSNSDENSNPLPKASCIILTVNSDNTLAYNFYLRREFVPIKIYNGNRVLMHYRACDLDHFCDRHLVGEDCDC